MPTYTVHAPPPRKRESAVDPARFLFLRDGFHFWAFLLAPLWLLVKRLWLVFLFYVLVIIAIGVVLRLVHAPSNASLLAAFVIALLMGLEAATLRRWTLTRRGWRMLGFVVGDDRESAERRFYAAWAEREEAKAAPPQPSPASVYAQPMRRGSPPGSDVIGLFPEPGGRL